MFESLAIQCQSGIFLYLESEFTYSQHWVWMYHLSPSVFCTATADTARATFEQCFWLTCIHKIYYIPPNLSAITSHSISPVCSKTDVPVQQQTWFPMSSHHFITSKAGWSHGFNHGFCDFRLFVGVLFCLEELATLPRDMKTFARYFHSWIMSGALCFTACLAPIFSVFGSLFSGLYNKCLFGLASPQGVNCLGAL